MEYLDFCPAFWEWFIEENSKGRVLSIDQVRDELLADEDELAEWTKQRGETFVWKTDPAILPTCEEVSDWVQSQNFGPTAVNTFL